MPPKKTLQNALQKFLSFKIIAVVTMSSTNPGISQTGMLVGGAVALAAVAAGGYALFGGGLKVAKKKQAKYGEWRSPITTQLIVAKSKNLSWLQVNFSKFHKI